MKRWLLLAATVLAVALAACAGPDLVAGTNDGPESETVREDQAPNGSAAGEAPAADEPTRSESEPNLSDSEGQLDSEESAGQEPSDGTSPTRVTSTTVQKTTPTSPAAAPPPDGTVPPSVVDSDLVVKAKADLGQRLGIDTELIEVVSVQEVDWPDTSIGCPQPGMGYAQVLVSGSLVVLEVNGISYEYHSATGEDPFYCATPTPPAPPGYGDR